MRIRKKIEAELREEDLEFIASVADALAHPVRLKLFRHIMQANRSVEKVCNKDLVEAFGYAQATISQHMQKLVIAGLIQTKKKDRSTYYYANLGILTKFLDLSKRYAL